MKIGVVGVGLMGGSLCKTLLNTYTDCIIYGVDTNKQNIQDALKIGLISKIASIDELVKKDLDYIFLCISASGVISLMNTLKNTQKKTTIIDFASTKEKISKKIPKKLKSNFVLAHPMCGTEKSGAKNAIDGLYANNIAIICDKNNYQKIHLQKANMIFRDMKMKIFYMKSKTHDKHIADISHMPHVLSYALSRSVIAKKEPKTILRLSGGGFKDMSRIAKSSPDMWIDIFCENSKNVLKSIKCVQKEIKAFKKILKSKNPNKNELKKWIKGANKLHSILD